MLDIIVIDDRTQKLIRRNENVKLDTAARDFMIACALSLKTGKELTVGIRPHDPRGDEHRC